MLEKLKLVDMTGFFPEHTGCYQSGLHLKEVKWLFLFIARMSFGVMNCQWIICVCGSGLSGV